MQVRDGYGGVSIVPRPDGASARARRLVCRHWAFTVWLDESADGRTRTVVTGKLQELPEKARYLVWQLEKGDNGSTDRSEQVHVQGHVSFEAPISLATAKRRIGFPWLHASALRTPIEVSRHINYCKKEESRLPDGGPFEFGDAPSSGQGRRTDLDLVCAAIQEGKTLEVIAEKFPNTMVRYPSGIATLKRLLCKPYRRPRVVVVVLWGDSGTGKSTRAWDMFPGAYPKANEFWWANYSGEKIVIWDEFDSTLITSLAFSSTCDVFPKHVPSKGCHTGFGMELLIITTNRDPAWWTWANAPSDEEARAWKRRLTHTWHVELPYDGPAPEWWDARRLLPDDHPPADQ